jgi:hypothetical protein
MATVHSKTGSGGKRSRKVRVSKRRPAKKLKEATSRPKVGLAAAVEPATTDRLGRPEANASAIRVQGRLTKMLQVEMDNLDKVEALLRILKIAMEHTDLTERGGPWFQEVVEVAANLAWRSNMDLQDLALEGRIVNPLLAMGQPDGR